ncbi:3-oxoacyl-[acyl-carrier-protein] reductase FabG [Corynebacterium kalinowskii]|uniref:3-oxoacyl-[acyl-carrier-protein] reductase FabG n=1 Tax=Corynebacterium kalinowskii TaxID=2675216 RepID=A0A6B8VN10_9CORY|nr:SDR family NAD(P)-dependent oxidoreductase [Corynebacterium kalinowskii]QGU01151.1 3-oxoacyl-[acyl-carrier-protein] reductase FabG [Corynebacterium kalinowskii]
MDITGKAAIITGGASGLGAATARALIDAGVNVYAFDLQAGDIEGVNYRTVDVTDPEAVTSAVQQVAAEAELRLLVACAGICPSQRIMGRKGPHDLGLYAKTIQVNLIGTFNVLTAFSSVVAELEPLDSDGQRGVAIMTASVAAFEGQVGQAAYASSKGGIHALTITAARDLASLGIRVCSIAPGVVNTPMMASVSDEFREELESRVQFPSRMAEPSEYALLVEQIVANNYLNGETIRLDGGLRMPPR